MIHKYLDSGIEDPHMAKQQGNFIIAKTKLREKWSQGTKLQALLLTITRRICKFF